MTAIKTTMTVLKNPYPAVLFPAECLRITHELIGKYFLSEDYILQYFHDKGIRFPISLAEFLSRVDIK